MSFCPKCGKEYKDGAGFCGGCGNPLPKTTPAQPSEPQINNIPYTPSDDLDKTVAIENDPQKYDYNNAPETEYNGQYTEYSAEGGPIPETQPKKKKGKKKLIITLIILLLLAGAAVLAYFLFFAEEDKPDCALYIKDGELYYASLGSSIEPVQIAVGLSEEDYDVSPSITNDEETIIYADNYNDGEYLLYRAETSNPSPVVIKTVSGHKLLPEAKYVVYRSDEDLYQYDLESANEIMIKEGARYSGCSEDESRILYKVSNYNHYYSLYTDTYYVKDLDGNEVMIDSDIAVFDYTEDLETFYYIKDSSLYKKGFSSAEVIVDNSVTDIFAVFDDGEMYYEKDGMLYYYDGATASKIYNYEIAIEIAATEAPVAVFGTDDTYMITAGSNTRLLEHDDIEKITVNESGSTVYFLADTKKTMSYNEETDTSSATFESAVLYIVTIDGADISAETIYDDNVVQTEWINDDKLLYSKNEIEVDGFELADLYINREMVDTQVLPTALAEDSEKFTYAKNPVKTDSASLASFYLYDEGSTVKIADNAAGTYFTPGGDVIYISNPNSEDNTADLYYFNGSDSVLIAKSVEAVFRNIN